MGMVLVDNKLCNYGRKCNGECLKVCASKAISIIDQKAFIDQNKCDRDGICIAACRAKAVSYLKI